MAKPMPEHEYLTGAFTPLRMECNAPNLLIEGEIPREIRGSFYRCGPSPQFAPRSDEYHLFAGDGMVHAFHIEDGRVDYLNRWVRTNKFKAERRLGRSAINPMNPFDCDPEFSDFVFSDKDGTANTAAVWHGNRLLIMEEGHPPYELDPDTLESKGSWNFLGKLQTAMTAHPKVDPNTGEMVLFAYMATGPFAADLAVHKVNKEGLLTESVVIPTPYSAMVHDFVVTENHIVFAIFPLTGDLERAMVGKPPFAWEPEKGVKIGVLPRQGSSADNITWIDADIAFAFHFMNGFDHNGVITFDCCQSEHAPLFPDADGNMSELSPPYLTRWVIDTNADTPAAVFSKIDSYESEFPLCDSRYEMADYRYGFYLSPVDGSVRDGGSDTYYNAIARYDHHDGSSERYGFGNAYVSEAVFVPKSEQAGEGDGYLLTVVTDNHSMKSKLCIMDAMDLTKGPVATAFLSHQIPVGFHGHWRQA
ncbi:Lignostilbene-alpha,beta-dioxygenase isozyme III [Sinobacterium norvegicum]|uniref:Lignostilbene-alpha,beta-dioxygenase isozyme III n=1 Tax=Sinobacterium norvegicum TaxID=1641715 RepID=A0ABN8EDH1_9GAMM|nr:carotenoid oxygenase family protein [Sinobacterium norvegicum]CAH0990019.1 Lignostilbene-alpha,beta-dioxygenase isozyme III [Sinobacterium norvegicum]